jgi:hypothetical protein
MRELAVRDRRLNEGAMGRGVGQWVQVWCLPAILLPSRFLAFLSPSKGLFGTALLHKLQLSFMNFTAEQLSFKVAEFLKIFG